MNHRHTFVFRNKDTGEIRRAMGDTLNVAARHAAIPVEFRDQLPEPWMPWSCWNGDDCQWHFTEDGSRNFGPRP